MKVLVDSCVWSLALRRRMRVVNDETVHELAKLVADGRVAMIGAVRQEVLSGIREPDRFETIRFKLSPYADLELEAADYEMAASYFTRCRNKGIQGSSTDFLICAAAVRYALPIFTTDRDFVQYKKLLPIRLFNPIKSIATKAFH